MNKRTITIAFARVLNGALLALGLFVLLCSAAKPAYAYVDPGSGLFLLQILGTTLAGFVFMVRKRIRQMLSVFGAKNKESQ
jgi:hypothetical protein